MVADTDAGMALTWMQMQVKTTLDANADVNMTGDTEGNETVGGDAKANADTELVADMDGDVAADVQMANKMANLVSDVDGAADMDGNRECRCGC